eukprot:TRINITY_DN1011_c0_g1_i2.p2 TRINITY_DN1011_c0_g1~~TRINITY_DN1011_c0_g1_i2.p2  ORF type:complete len:130 (-),score=47.32 TRINITY_DN1011_c0_g1_i2:26-415(-)
MSSDNTVGVEEFLKQLLERVEDLQAVIVTDRDGVVVVQAKKTDFEEKNETQFATAFAMASEQASKLRMGDNKSITSCYDSRMVVHVNLDPLIVTLVTEAYGNAGLLVELGEEIAVALDPVMDMVEKVDN